jgi:myo-inositol-1(or 4)-monophosphatase
MFMQPFAAPCIGFADRLLLPFPAPRFSLPSSLFAIRRPGGIRRTAMSNSQELLKRIDLAKAAVTGQTALMHRFFGRAQSNWKSDGTRVTPVDLEISGNIAQTIAASFPRDRFFSEELAHEGGPIPADSRFCWMLDPIDGTNNYALGLASCAIGLALFEEGEPVYGVVYDHSRSRLIHGGPGFGTWDGEEHREVRNEPAHAHSLVGFHSPYDRRFSEQARRVVESYKIRALGSSTLHLAYVATGVLDGLVDHNVKLWDIASAIPLVRAAGGEVRFLDNNPLPLRSFDLKMPRIRYVAGSPAMCDHLCRTLAE